MPNSYRTTDEVTVQKDDGNNIKLYLKKLSFLASGAFSNVYKGTASTTESSQQREVVIKKTWHATKTRTKEESILRHLGKLKHKNIVMLLYSYHTQHKDCFCLALVFEWIPSNLHQYLKSLDRRIDILEVKLITWQLFRGQAHLQRQEICHRDIKPQNLLFNPETGLLKISDYGASFILSEEAKQKQKSYQVTRYYRPPELILGSREYGCEIDIWSCGCIFGELLRGRVHFVGKTTEKQAEVIFNALDVPTSDDLKSMKVDDAKYKEILKNYEPDHQRKSLNFSYIYEQTDRQQSDANSRVMNEKINLEDMKQATMLLRRVLVYNPKDRLSGIKFLMHKFFNDLFEETSRRENGKSIACLSKKDLDKVSRGDRTLTHTTADTGETREI